MTENSEWMGTDEISRELGISHDTVRKMLVADGVKVLHLRRKWRIKRTDYEAMVQRRYTTARDKP